MPLAYHILDVFTEAPLSGNPLAVVLEADALGAKEMHALAREFNLSETVFVQRATRADCRMRARIFTPTEELSFAGHPTVGTACLLAQLGLVEGADEYRFQLEEGAGPVPVYVRREPEGYWFGQLTAPQLPQWGPQPPPTAALAEVIGLEEGDLRYDAERARYCSAGLPFLLIPIRSPEVLASAALDLRRWHEVLAGAWSPQLYLYTRNYEGELQARMFGPGVGVVEDPATGSAAAALTGALALEAPQTDGRLQWTIRQGLEMGRPSLLRTEADKLGGRVTAVRVGGRALRVAEGRLLLGF